MKNYPHYRTDNICHWYKVYSDDNCIQICLNSFGQSSIQVATNSLAFYSEDQVDCSEAEFLQAYYEVRRKLDEICLIKIDK